MPVSGLDRMAEGRPRKRGGGEEFLPEAIQEYEGIISRNDEKIYF